MASNPTSHSLPAKPSTTTSASLSFMAQPQNRPSPSPPANDTTTHHHHLLYQQRLANHALLPPLDIHNTRFSSSKLAHSMATGPATAATHLNSPSAAAFGALGFGHPMMDGGLGLLSTNDLDPAGTLSEMFEGQLSLAGVGHRADGGLHRETNLKSISDGGWICSSTRCLAHNLPNNSHCYICRSPRPHDMPLTTTSSNPSTPPRSASSSSSTFSFPPSPSSTASFGSGPAAFMYPKQQQQNNSPVGAPLRLQGTSGALSGGTSLGLMMGGKTLYSTPPPPSLHLPPLQNPNGTVGQLGGGGIGPTTPQVLPLPALPPHLLPARLGGSGNGGVTPQPQSQPFLLQNTTTPQLTSNPLLNLTALTNILAPSGLRLSQGGRVRNVCPDAANPILMFWPDNEPLPVLGQCRPPLPPDFSKNGSGARDGESARGAAAAAGVGDANEARKANGLPPILNTGNVGPMEKQPLDWTCGVCKYINWRRRKVCQCCFPYAPGNEPPANHEDKLKIISALLTSSSSGASASGAPSASLPLGPAGMFNSGTSSAFNVTPAPHSFAPSMNTNATTPPSLATQHQLFQQLQRDQHQLLQMQLQLQIQKAQAQLTLFTQQQQQQLQQRQGFGGGGVGTLGVAGNGGMVGWNNNSVPSSASASSSEMGSSRAGSPFILGNKSAAALTNLAPMMNSGLLAKPTTPMSTTSAAAPTQSSPSPLSIFSATSGTKKSIWAMDGGSSTPASSASGSPSSTARSSPTSFNNAVDPEATVKLGSAVWFGSGAVSQTPASAVVGNRFGEIGSGKAPQFLPGAFGGAGVARKASLPMSQIGAATFGSSSSSGSPTGLGNASFFSSSSLSLPSLNGPRTPVSGMATPGTGSFGIGNGGSALF